MTTPALEIQVSLAPQTAQVVLRGQAQFSATVSGSSAGVSWSVNGVAGGNATVGAIDNTGLYTAPNALPTPNTVTVSAASSADPSQSATAAVTIVNPAPVLSSISPATVNAGSGNTTLTVTGTGFAYQSVVEVGGTVLATVYVNPTVMTAVVSAAQLASAGNLGVAVTTPAPGGGTSSAVTLSVVVVVAVNPPAQTLTVGQAQQFTATVTGSTNQGATWSVNGVTGGSATAGTIDNTGLYAAPGVPPTPNIVTVTATSLADPMRSATASVTIVNPAPAVSSISPATINAGSGNTTLTVTGTGFINQSTVELGSAALATTYGSATQLTAAVSAAQLANAGSLAVEVTTPGPGGGTSNAVTLSVVVVVAVNPQAQTLTVGQAQQFAANVTGSSNQGTTWSVNGVLGGNATLGTIGNTGLYTAPLAPPAPNVVAVQATSVTEPTQSAAASVTIVNPAPVLSSISPTAAGVGSGNTSLTLTGTGFASQSVVEVGTTPLATTYVNPTMITAVVPPAQLANAGSLAVQVTTPAPGGGTSSAATLAVVSAQGTVTATGNLQVALYSFTATQSASVSIEFGTDTTYGLHTWAQSIPAGGGTVQILVAGMMGNTTYHMRADVSFADGTELFDQDHTFTTGALPPSRVPQIAVTNPNGLSPSPGAILLHLWPGTSNQLNIAAVDNAGNLIWYYDYDSSLGYPQPIKPLPNGHMLMNLSAAGSPNATSLGLVQEIDLAGNVISQFAVADLNNWLSAAGFNLVVNSIHHDLLPLPNGHLIVLVNHYQDFTNLTGYPGTTAVLGDALVDLDPNNNPVWVWDVFDNLCSTTVTTGCLDINRQPLGFPDWTHSNAVVYSPDDGNLIVSMRNQGWVIKIDYDNGQGSGNILWRLGYQGDFALTNGQNPDWFYAQHYPSIVSPNSTGVFNLEVFDDGDNRVLDTSGDVCGASGQPACYSRVPIFQLDEAGLTATILWQDNLSPVYSYWGGSAQQLSDTNVVFGITTPSDDPTGARYMEVTDDPTPQVVLQMEVSGQNAYRAVHLPSLYPGVQW